MRDENKFKQEFEKTGHAYGFFVMNKPSGSDAKVEFLCQRSLLKHEYDDFLFQQSRVMSISSFGEIVGDVKDAFHNVLIAMDNIECNDYSYIKEIRDAFESFIETLVKAKTHFSNQLEEVIGNDISEMFEHDVSGIYDSGNSYALVYKLRNVCQHDGKLPLKLNRTLDTNGTPVTQLTLDGNALLEGRAADYLNSKVKKFISSEPEVDIFSHSVMAYDQIVGLMNHYIQTTLVDESCISYCVKFAEIFLSLKEPTDLLILTDMQKTEDDSSEGFNVTQSQIPLKYLCKILSLFLKGKPGLLFSFWGQSISPNTESLLPGVFNLIGPEYFSNDQVVEINKTEYMWIQRSLAFSENSIEMTALLVETREVKPNAQLTEECWNLYQTLIKCLKMMSKLSPPVDEKANFNQNDNSNADNNANSKYDVQY